VLFRGSLLGLGKDQTIHEATQNNTKLLTRKPTFEGMMQGLRTPIRIVLTPGYVLRRPLRG
jgi:hypothetical protein